MASTARVSREPDPSKQFGAYLLDVVRRCCCDSCSNYGVDQIERMSEFRID